MSEPFLGEITMFGGNFNPRGWALCDGQLLPISQNSALFSILGTTYGGDGRTTFQLPDLRGRSPKHAGQGPGLSNVRLGQRGGREEVALTEREMPSHSHTATLHGEKTAADNPNPSGRMLAGATIYAEPIAKDDKAMAPGSVLVQNAGGGQSFGIDSPYTAVNFIIALQGIFPSRS